MDGGTTKFSSGNRWISVVLYIFKIYVLGPGALAKFLTTTNYCITIRFSIRTRITISG
eukprot:SAG31_NODE_654_length_13128_cov_10.472408_4_plen_58_part_00